MYIKVTRKTHLKCFGISLILIAALFFIISDISFLLYVKGYNTLVSVSILCSIMIPVTFIHELIHAATFRIFGGVVKIGFKGLYAYTQELSGITLTRTQFAIVLLAPAALISAIAMLISGWIGAVVFVLNIVGSVGDLYMAFVLIKHGPCKIINKQIGFEVIKGA